jgi:XTP/dITP diphosphohydrolase
MDEITKILLATGNAGKLEEIVALLRDLPLDLLTPAMLGISQAVPELGDTYQENAALKAKAYAKASALLTLADDSGLEVDALDGAPGLHSARFSPIPAASDADRRLLLLEKLKVYPPPWTARFRCVVALAAPGGAIHFAEGTCPGEIIPVERGQFGFGYDPLFLVGETGRTMAELPMLEKNTLSHRALAIKAIRPLLIELYLSPIS